MWILRVDANSSEDLGRGQTTAKISSHGLRHGTDAATFANSGLDGPVTSYAFDIGITTAIGALTAPLMGTFDVTTGTFGSSSTTVTGSGALSSAIS